MTTKERPILFSAPMVRALLDGSKTQTRRVVKPQPVYDGRFAGGWKLKGKKGHEAATCSSLIAEVCPYGQPGDRLWVREAWRTYRGNDATPPRDLTTAHRIWYEADDRCNAAAGKLRPSMFMPRWASRITLEVTGVRVERLQDISEADSVAEGIERQEDGLGWKRGPISSDHPNTATRTAFPRLAYQSLWEQINGPDSWEATPWVWAIEFKRIDQATA